MARYTGPKWKINRRENATVLGDDSWKRRPAPPGQHGFVRKRMSNYAIQFREKQKIKRTYGLLEKQFRKFYAKANKTKGNTGVRLLQLLEMRLDNVIYRLKIGKTRAQARQFVNHGHVLVNGDKVDIPSYLVSIGDVVELKKSMRDNELITTNMVERKAEPTPQWIEQSGTLGKIVAEPLRDDIDKSLREQLVIELYSRYNIK